MDVREELHAVLEELDSDELPDPEALRCALRGLWPGSRNDMLRMPADALEEEWLPLRGSRRRLGAFGPVGDPRRVLMFAVVPSETAELELRQLHGRTWERAVEALLPGALAQSELEGVSKPAESSSSQKRPPLQDVPGAEHEPKKPRRMPRSAGMGRGPADLSQREGFGPPEDGEAG